MSNNSRGRGERGGVNGKCGGMGGWGFMNGFMD